MNLAELPLPTYGLPPLVETAFSVLFKPISGFSNAHMGLFWGRIRDRFPKLTQLPPIDATRESFEKTTSWLPRGLNLQLTQDPACRYQMRSEDGERMIQIQPDRMVLNWMRCAGSVYPRYERLRQDFDNTWAEFTGYLKEELETEPRPDQWEAVYVNIIPRGDLWQTAADWPSILPGLFGRLADASPGRIETATGQWTYRFENPNARLHVETRIVQNQAMPEKHALQLSLTARGPIDLSPGHGLGEGLDYGHRMIVLSFRQMASERANQHWQLQT